MAWSTHRQGLRTGFALLLIVASLALLEGARSGVEIRNFSVGQTPVTAFARPEADGPAVVIAHGFAGSRQMMQGYALPLARAGYRVFVFDFLGHGRNPIPMSGDVTSVDGTTRLLVDQTQSVIDAVSERDVPVALLGHSMATDVLVRVASERSDVGPVVLISAFSEKIDATHPKTLLLVTGAWEKGLRSFALRAARMVAPDADEGETVSAGPVMRRAEVAPLSEHVSVLQSRVGRAAALRWLDQSYERTSNVTVLPTGWAILGLLGGLVLLFSSVSKVAPENAVSFAPLSFGRLATVAFLPAVVAPLVAVPLNPKILPVLVADYLALHLAVFGVLQLGLIWLWKIRPGRFSPAAFGLLLIWACLFGLALDRYAANFWPTSGRLSIMIAVALGALPYMIADAILTHRAPFLRRLVLRGGFVLSLGLAVALDFEELFFLIMIAPVVILFYLVFGTMGRAISTRSGPLAPGIALGLVLAWAIGVSFPLFQAG